MTQKKIRGQKPLFLGQTLAKPRTGMVEAKAKNRVVVVVVVSLASRGSVLEKAVFGTEDILRTEDRGHTFSIVGKFSIMFECESVHNIAFRYVFNDSSKIEAFKNHNECYFEVLHDRS